MAAAERQKKGPANIIRPPMRTPAPRRITAPPEECRATESRERKRPCWGSTRLPDLIDRSRTREVACLLSIGLFTVTSGFGSLMPLTIYYCVALLATGLLVIGTLRAAAAEEPIPEQIERTIEAACQACDTRLARTACGTQPDPHRRQEGRQGLDRQANERHVVSANSQRVSGGVSSPAAHLGAPSRAATLGLRFPATTPFPHRVRRIRWASRQSGCGPVQTN